MKNAFVWTVFLVVAALAFPAAASAGCTANFTCSNACFLEKTCTSPYPPCELFCSANNQVVSCSGNTTCSVGTNSVTCDGVTKTCSANQCTSSTYSIRCGGTTRNCTYNCPL